MASNLERQREVDAVELTPDLILANTHVRGHAKGSGMRQTMYRTPEEARRVAESLR